MLHILGRGLAMKTINAGEAEKTLKELLEETAASHEPIQIISEPSNGILISEEDCRAIHETLYLLSIPGMRESIRQGMAAPVDECSSELNW
jgi:PHD/YefM family antitoxin component YafN of YafNO toxin-antitoxin module